MTDRQTAVPVGGEQKRFTTHGGADRPVLRFGALDSFVFEDTIDEDMRAGLTVWLNHMLDSDRGCAVRASADTSGAASAPPPPAPVGGEKRMDIARALRQWHQNTCYPDALDADIQIGVDAVLDALARPSADTSDDLPPTVGGGE